MLGSGLGCASDLGLAEEFMPYSLLFDGANDHVILGGAGIAPANGTIKPLTTGLTYAAWVKYDPETPENATKGPYFDTTTHAIINATKSGGGVLSYANTRFHALVHLIDGDGNTATLQVLGPATRMIHTAGATEGYNYMYKENGWHFVVMTWDGNKVLTLYVDGGTNQQGNTSGGSSTNYGSDVVSVTHGSDPSGNNPDGVNKWYINYSTVDGGGAAGSIGTDTGVLVGTGILNSGASSGAQMMEGSIGDIAIWDVALTNSEIEALYNNHRPVDMSTTQASNLQGYWRTKAGNGTVLEELTGNVLNTGGAAINATLESGTGWSADTPTNTHEPNVLLGEYV